MSRIGKQPVAVPASVKVTVDGSTVRVEGPKGKLEASFRPEVTVKHDTDAKAIVVTRPDDERLSRALHGLTRSLIQNMVKGVINGYEKRLKVEGIGYQARKDGKAVTLTVGYANAISLTPPDGVTFDVPDPTTIVVRGRRQAEGRPVRRRGAGGPQAGTVQGQGRPLRERSGPPQGRQVLRQRRV